MTVSWLWTGDMWRYLSLPVISALVGYVTNAVAIRMMFHPVEFKGVLKPWLGWQGVVPRNASKMTGIAVDMITESLLSAGEMFRQLDSRQIMVEIEGPLLAMIDDVTEDIMQHHYPELWARAPEGARQAVRDRLHRVAPQVVEESMTDLRDNIDQLFDLKRMITRRLIRDKPLINRIFKQVGHDEFIFVERSGAYFGFAFGLIQMLVWVVFQPWWLLPLFGLMVGWATNWLALKLIFHPRQPRRIGPFRLQGLFFRRQDDVAAQYGRLIAEHVITPENILDELFHGPHAHKLDGLIQQEAGAALDDAMGAFRSLQVWPVGAHEYARLKADAQARVSAEMPALFSRLSGYIRHRMAIHETLEGRLRQMTPTQFEGMLRPAFEEDEWILVAVGAVLGFAAGWMQLIFIFARVFEQQLGGFG